MPWLLDTHVILWMANEPGRLSAAADFKLNEGETLLFSYASVWEIAIKAGINKIKLDSPLKDFINQLISKHSLELLPVTLNHIYEVNVLPLHHRDPFDRLLIAQSIVEKIDIVSSDVMFDAYDIKRRW